MAKWKPLGRFFSKSGRSAKNLAKSTASTTTSTTAKNTGSWFSRTAKSSFNSGKRFIGKVAKGLGIGAGIGAASSLGGSDNSPQAGSTNNPSQSNAGKVDFKTPNPNALETQDRLNERKSKQAAEKNAEVEKKRHVDQLTTQADKAKADVAGLKHALNTKSDTDAGKKPIKAEDIANGPLAKKYLAKNGESTNENTRWLITIAKLLETNNDLAYKNNELVANKNLLDRKQLEGELIARSQESAELQKTIRNANSANADVAAEKAADGNAKTNAILSGIGNKIGSVVAANKDNIKGSLWELGILGTIASLPVISKLLGNAVQSISNLGEGISNFFEGLGNTISEGFSNTWQLMKDTVNTINPFRDVEGNEISDEAKQAEIDAAVKGVIAGNEARLAHKAEKAAEAEIKAGQQMKKNSRDIKAIKQQVKSDAQHKNYWKEAEQRAAKEGDQAYAEVAKKNAEKYNAKVKEGQAKLKATRVENTKVATSDAGKAALRSEAENLNKVTKFVETQSAKKGVGQVGKAAGKALKSMSKQAAGKLIAPLFAAMSIEDFNKDEDKEMATLKLLSDISMLGGPIGMIGGIMIDAIRTQVADKRQHMEKLYADAIAKDLDDINNSVLNKLAEIKGSPVDIINERFGGMEFEPRLTPLDHSKKLAALGAILSAYKNYDNPNFTNSYATENTDKLFVPWSYVQGRLKDLGIDVKFNNHEKDLLHKFKVTPVTKGNNTFAQGLAHTKASANAYLDENEFQEKLAQLGFFDRVGAIWNKRKAGSALGEIAMDAIGSSINATLSGAKSLSNKIGLTSAAKWTKGAIKSAWASKFNPVQWFAKGTDLNVGGQYEPLPTGTAAIVGDGGKEERVVIGNQEFKTPNKPTLTYLPAGSIVEPTTARLQNKKASYIGGIPTLEDKKVNEFANLPKYAIGTLNGQYGDVVGYTMQRFVKAGYTPVQAAGIVGNLMGEGLLNSKGYSWEHNDVNGPSAGIAQFHDVRGKKGELSKLKEWARSKNRSWEELDTQIDYLLESAIPVRSELESALKNSKTVEDAAFHWGNKYEIFGPDNAYRNPRHQQYKIRSNYGHDALAYYRDKYTHHLGFADAGKWRGPGKGDYRSGTDGNLSNYQEDHGGVSDFLSGLSFGGSIMSKVFGDKLNPSNILSAAFSVTDKDLAANAKSIGLNLGQTSVRGLTTAPKGHSLEPLEKKSESTDSKQSPIVANSGNIIKQGDTNQTIINQNIRVEGQVKSPNLLNS